MACFWPPLSFEAFTPCASFVTATGFAGATGATACCFGAPPHAARETASTSTAQRDAPHVAVTAPFFTLTSRLPRSSLCRSSSCPPPHLPAPAQNLPDCAPSCRAVALESAPATARDPANG